MRVVEFGRRREFAKLRDMELVGLRPDRDLRFARPGARQERLRDRDDNLLFGKPRHADRGLSRDYDLTRLDQRCSDDAGSVRNNRRIGQTVFRKFDRPLSALEPRPRFVGCRLGLVQLRVGRPALLLKFLGARFGSTGLREDAARGGELGVGLLRLQPQIGLVERCKGLSGLDHRPDLHQPFRHLPSHAEADIAFDPGANGPNKAAIGNLGLVMGAGDQDRPYRRRVLRCDLVAPGQPRCQHSNGRCAT